MKKIYVGCSLIHATQEFRDSIESLKETLREEGFEVLRFKGVKNGKPNGTPEEVYTWDISCVRGCDLFVAECSFPSSGLGIEIGTANAFEKPVIAVAMKGAIVSSMIVGNISPNFSFHRYSAVDEIIPLVHKELDK